MKSHIRSLDEHPEVPFVSLDLENMDRDACDAIGRWLDCVDKAGVLLSFLFVPPILTDIANEAERTRRWFESRHKLRDCNDGGPGVI